MKNKERQQVIERAKKKHPDGWSAQLCYWCGHERLYHLMFRRKAPYEKTMEKNGEISQAYIITTWCNVPSLQDAPCLRGPKNNTCGCWRFDTVKEAVAATLAGDAHPHRKVSAGYWREKEAI